MKSTCNYELKEIQTLPRTRLVSFLAEIVSIFQCYDASDNSIAFWPKTAVFDTFGKIAVSRLIDVFSRGFLHSQNLG